MNKVLKYIQSYLLFAFPFVLASMFWSSFDPERGMLSSSLLRLAWEVLSYNLMAWFVTLIIFLVFLVASATAREKTLKRLANIKERDEREQYITGKASRAAYISTLSLLIFFLFISIFSLNIYRAPESEAVNGKTGTVAIGLGFSLIDKPRLQTDSENKVIFETKDIPLSKTAIILILIAWQLMIFNVTARREMLN